MVKLTDLAIFEAITKIVGENTGVFVPDNEAFSRWSERYGNLKFPIFSLYWGSASTRGFQRNMPAARVGSVSIRDEINASGKRVKVVPISITYDLRIWQVHEADLLDTLKEVYFFSMEAGGNGVTLDYPEAGLEGVGIPLNMDMSMTIEKSDHETLGTYYKGSMSMTASTWFAKGLDQKLINKIIMNLYASSGTMYDGNDVLVATREIVP